MTPSLLAMIPGTRGTIRATMLAISIVVIALPVFCQTPPLQITAPLNGTSFTPGQSLSVVIQPVAGAMFAAVFVVGENPIGFSSVASAPPYQFSLTIPPNTSPGTYTLTAVGSDSAGSLVQSSPVTISVERSEMPTQIYVEPANVIFDSRGEQLPLKVNARFPDGTVLNVSTSSRIAVASSDIGVVTSTVGTVLKAVGPGNATVSVTYSQGSQKLTVTVPVTVSPDIITVSPLVLTFPDQSVGSTSPPTVATVRNAGNAAIQIRDVGVDGDFKASSTCTGNASLAPGGTCPVTVTFTPTGDGQRSGTLTITNSFSVSPLVVPLSGNGLGAATNIIPSSLSFVPQAVGTTSPSQRITVANSGSSNLIIGAVATEGEFAATNNCVSLSPLSKGAICGIDVSFKPLAGGIRTGTVTISDNVNGSPQTIAVVGVGSTNKGTPLITWPKPTSIGFGTALGNGQLNATANVPGTFLYSPSSGTVLPVGNAQTLSASFTPSDLVNYGTASSTTTIDVLPGTATGVQIIVTNLLKRDANNNIVVTLTLANAGLSAANNVTLTAVRVGTTAASPVPQVVGNVPANSLAQVIVTVPGSAGASGAASSLTVSGTYTGGTISVASRITLP